MAERWRQRYDAHLNGDVASSEVGAAITLEELIEYGDDALALALNCYQDLGE